VLKHCLMASWVLAALFPLAAFAASRNVVLFLTDDQSPDAGWYGSPVPRQVCEKTSDTSTAKSGNRMDVAMSPAR